MFFVLAVTLVLAITNDLSTVLINEEGRLLADASQRSNVVLDFPGYAYIILFLRYLISPVLILRGIFTKNIFLVLFPSTFYILLALSAASKVDIFILLITLTLGVFSSLFRFDTVCLRLRHLALLFSSVLSIGFIFSFVLPSRSFINVIVSQIFMRIFYLQGLITSQYFDFFGNNPLNYFTHIKLLSAFSPYSYSLPKVLGQVYGGGNLNSGWLSVEGFSSLGVIFGPVVASLILLGVFNLLDYQFRYTFFSLSSLLVLLPLTIIFLDTPFVTSLSSGALFVYALCSKALEAILLNFSLIKCTLQRLSYLFSRIYLITAPAFLSMSLLS